MPNRMPKTRRGKFWSGVMKTMYNYRGWWVDAPTLSLLGLYHWHFYSQGAHPVPDGMPEFSWAVLAMYLLVKEGVRWILHGIQSRRGSILVALWLLSLLEFYFIMAIHPDSYTMPSQMELTTIIVLAGFLGLLPVKRMFVAKYASLADAFLPHDEKKQ